MKCYDKKFPHTDERENAKLLSEDEMDNAVGGHYSVNDTDTMNLCPHCGFYFSYRCFKKHKEICAQK